MSTLELDNQLISIVIPCYNDSEYIEQSIQSALIQTYPHIEIIVVDDGSDNLTKAVLKKLESKITQLITQQNKGQSSARNEGIKNAAGQFILVLDSDDYFESSFCEEAIEIFKSNSSIKIVTCHANVIELSKKSEIYKPKGGDIELFKYENGALGTSMFKRKDWELIDGYDEIMRTGFEDWEFFIRLLKFGGNAYVIEKTLYNYRKREVSTNAKAIKIRYDLWLYIFTKHRDLYESDFESLITFFLSKLKQTEITSVKYKEKIDYKIGSILLKPFRVVKHIFKLL